MPISYRDSSGKDNKIIPAPQIGISKEYITTGDGKKVGATFTITLEGQLVPHKGSPLSDGTFYDGATAPSDESISEDKIQYSLFRKAEAMRNLFSSEGRLLTISHWQDDDKSAASGYPRVRNIDFPTNQYASVLPYTITLETDEMFGHGAKGTALQAGEDYVNASVNIIHESGTGFEKFSASSTDRQSRVYLSRANEEWQTEFAGQIKNYGNPQEHPSYPPDSTDSEIDELDTFNLTHTLSATGKRAYDGDGLIREAWENAKMWVEDRMGIPSGDLPMTRYPADMGITNNMFFDGTNGFTINGYDEYAPYNYIKSQSINKSDGMFSVTENWLIVKNEQHKKVIEDIRIDINDDPGTDTQSVTLAGTFTGLEERRQSDFTVTSGKFQNALKRFEEFDTQSEAFALAKNLSGNTNLKTPFLTKTVSKNEAAGTITFSYSFNDRNQDVTGSISETVNIVETPGKPHYAQIQVPGRTSGPVLQNLNTKTLNSVSVSCEVVMGPNYQTTAPNITDSHALWQKVLPLTHAARGAPITTEQKTWDPLTGRFNRQKTYEYNDDC